MTKDTKPGTITTISAGMQIVKCARCNHQRYVMALHNLYDDGWRWMAGEWACKECVQKAACDG